MIANSANRYAMNAKLQKNSQMMFQKLFQKSMSLPLLPGSIEPGRGLRVTRRGESRLEVFGHGWYVHRPV